MGDITFSFSEVLKALKEGKKVRRSQWTAFIYMVKSSQFKTNKEPLLSLIGEGVEVKYEAHIDMYYEDLGIAHVWVPTMDDILSEDWKVD